MDKFTGGLVSVLKHVADKRLKVSVADKVVQFPHSWEVMVGVGSRMR